MGARNREKESDVLFIAGQTLRVLKEGTDLTRYDQLQADLRKLPARALKPLAEAIDILVNGDGA